MHIGKLRYKVNVSSEFKALAKSDETAAEALASQGQYRQACYFIIQAMEKNIRHKVFTLVNPNIEYFRDRNRSHSLDDAADFLIEIISNDQVIQGQVSKQLKEHVLGDTRYNTLHNNLRYPWYFKKYDSYSVLEVNYEDYSRLKSRLDSLKIFLDDLHLFTS